MTSIGPPPPDTSDTQLYGSFEKCSSTVRYGITKYYSSMPKDYRPRGDFGRDVHSDDELLLLSIIWTNSHFFILFCFASFLRFFSSLTLAFALVLWYSGETGVTLLLAVSLLAGVLTNRTVRFT